MAASEVHEVKKEAPPEGEEDKKIEAEPYSVDREKVCTPFLSLSLFLLHKTCPFLLRVFCNEGRHHRYSSLPN